MKLDGDSRRVQLRGTLSTANRIPPDFALARENALAGRTVEEAMIKNVIEDYVSILSARAPLLRAKQILDAAP